MHQEVAGGWEDDIVRSPPRQARGGLGCGYIRCAADAARACAALRRTAPDAQLNAAVPFARALAFRARVRVGGCRAKGRW